jgi:hypothetical protein
MDEAVRFWLWRIDFMPATRRPRAEAAVDKSKVKLS